MSVFVLKKFQLGRFWKKNFTRPQNLIEKFTLSQILQKTMHSGNLFCFVLRRLNDSFCRFCALFNPWFWVRIFHLVLNWNKETASSLTLNWKICNATVFYLNIKHLFRFCRKLCIHEITSCFLFYCKIGSINSFCVF